MKVIELIANNRLESAIEKLLALSQNTDFCDEVVLQSARLNDIRQKERQGTISEDQASMMVARVRVALLDLAKKLAKDEVAQTPEYTTNLEHNKHSTEMGLEEFKQELLELIDICEMNTFFAKVEKCPYEYNKSMYHSLKNQFMMTNPMLNPCFMFSGQWKTFVGTLKLKRP